MSSSRPPGILPRASSSRDASEDEDVERQLAISASDDGDDRESGEVSEDEGGGQPSSFKGYRPEYEWPGAETESGSSLRPLPPPSGPTTVVPLPLSTRTYLARPDLRLVVLSTSGSFLKGKIVAHIRAEGCSVGRDSVPIPPGGGGPGRLRLREMAVSKFHANIFWDEAGEGGTGWAVADCGSMHGTFVWSGALAVGTSANANEDVRLSPSRVASRPKALRHMDTLTIGSTTFAVHVHQDGLPCEECLVSAENEIPLWEEKKRPKDGKGSTGEPGPYVAGRDKQRAHREDMASLRNALLARLPGSSAAAAPAADAAAYIDRSAKRRRLHPELRPSPSPSTSTPGPPSSPSTFSRPARPIPLHTPAEPVSAAPRAIPHTNIGHALLQKQGWKPGMTLGSGAEGSSARAEPVVAVGTTGRAGLGSKRLLGEVTVGVDGTGGKDGEGDWREEGRQRRYRALRE